MIFVQKANEMIWDGHKIVPFIDGKLETEDEELIRLMLNDGYAYIEYEKKEDKKKKSKVKEGV